MVMAKFSPRCYLLLPLLDREQPVISGLAWARALVKI